VEVVEKMEVEMELVMEEEMVESEVVEVDMEM